jgi:hypothetical protein
MAQTSVFRFAARDKISMAPMHWPPPYAPRWVQSKAVLTTAMGAPGLRRCHDRKELISRPRAEGACCAGCRKDR